MDIKVDMSEYRRVQVIWRDARGESGWHQIADLSPKLAIITTTGFIIEQTPEIIMIATSLCDEWGAGDITHIPAAWVVKIENI